MSSFLQADIFFFITSVATVALAILLAIVFVYVAKIAKHISNITKTIDDEAKRVADDISVFRAEVQEELEIARRSPVTQLIASLVTGLRQSSQEYKKKSAPKKRTTKKKAAPKKKTAKKKSAPKKKTKK